MDLRAGLVIGGQLFLLLLAFFLVPRHGLSGLAWAQIGQGLLLVIGGRLMLRKSLPGLTLLPLRWCKKVLREILVYGANIQLATLFGLMVDPITKVLMLHFGGVAASGYFEICNQLVLRVRSLIVMANQAVVPSATLLTETQSIRIREFYLNNMKILIFFLLPLMAFLFSWAGCVSLILLGEYKDQFVAMLGILTIAWTLNTFCAPVYFINIGSGRVGWNTFSHAIMGVLNGGLGWLFGMLYGSWGVLAGYVLALVAGGVVLLFVFHRQQGLSWRMILDREHVLLVLVCIATVGIYWWNPLKTFSFPLTLIDLVHWLAAPCILVFAMWTHRLRKMIWYSIFIK
jgi:O-antigen/teichoic acid export membrane protein